MLLERSDKITTKTTRFIIIALTYYGLAMVATLFKIEPSFASVVWPAAGAALVFALRYGQFAYLPIFIGALATNITLWGSDLTQLTAAHLGWHVLRAIGVVFQVFTSVFFIREICRSEINVNDSNTLLKVLLFVNPITATISPTFGAFTLYFQGLLGEQMLGFSWFVWWVGDFVGVLFFFLFFSIIIPISEQSNVSNKRVSITIALILFTSVVLAFQYSKQVYHQGLALSFSTMTERRFSEVQQLKRQIESNLFALGALFRNGFDPHIAHFEQVAKSLNKHQIPYRAIAWLDVVEHGEEAQWTSKQNERGIPNSEIKQLAVQPNSGFYYPISLTAPYALNNAAVGIDLASHPIAGPAAIEAIKSRSMRATDPIRLVQQSEKNTGNVVYYPVFAAQQGKLLGIAEIVIEVDKQLSKLLLTNDTNRQYSFFVSAPAFSAEPFINNTKYLHNADHPLHLVASYNLDWFGRDWIIRFESTEHFEQQKKDWLSWATLVFGLIIASLGVAFTLIITGFNEQLSQQVEQKTQLLETVITRLKKSDRVKNSFIANMSHEIRTPLNVILGTLQLLNNTTKPENQDELVTSALSSGRTLLAIINDILDISKLEAGKLTLENNRIDVANIITSAVKEFNHSAISKGLTIALTISDEARGYWFGDETRIKQILINLLSNAIKFTETGTITINVSVNDAYIIKITDEGIGLTKEQVANLFKRFEQADSSTTRKYGGSGLGLSIVQQLCHLMNGSVEVTSNLDVGSTFIVTLALERAEEAYIESNENNHHQPVELPPLGATKILLTEDNKLNQMVFKAMLAPSNADLVLAENGQEALELCKEHDFDMIFMDIQMPVMDGETACTELRKLGVSVPIIALTANVQEADVKRYLANGFNEHLAKPIEISSLSQVLLRYFYNQ